jgi:ABC-type nitrate/sulfonate/bicarbonate transport system ATPase subunit
MGADVAIACDDVSLTYSTKSGAPVEALRRVSFRINPGRVTALIGPSGCGKSTLLQIIRGLLSPSIGTIRFVDAQTGAAVAGKPRMATVWQAFNLFPWRTVADNVGFGLEISGITRTERFDRTRRSLAQVDLAGFEDKFPRQLSGGMRQRVGLARALVMEPEVLLLDEPFGALDAQTRLILQEQLARLVEKSGTTAVLVTHSIEEAILLADTILVMTARPGRIAAEIGVALPRPRSLATTHLPDYASLFDQIYGLLRDEVVRAMTLEMERT